MSNSVLGPGQVMAGRYRIERLLGEGGMGSVYRALQLPEERAVALKLLVDEHLGGAAVLERFEREARALARLVHPNTVRFLDSGRSESGQSFIVMELLEGGDLAEDLLRRGPMRWDHALLVCREVASSLVEAHEAGIVHRDIKPANIFLCSGPTWPIVKVLDFGIAGAVDPGARTRRLTLTGTVIGSASYMSPEQAQGKAVAPATDLYALGTVLFEMLAGKPPFDGLVFTAQLLAKVMQPAPGLRAVCPGLEVPTALHALVAELLERDPARRPASARQLVERVETLLGSASLPPLARGAAERHAPPNPAPAKTQAMLPPTVDQGWAPRRTEIAPPSRQRTRPRGLLRWALAAPVPMAAVFVWWTLRPQPAPSDQVLALLPEPSAPGAPVEAAPVPFEPAPAELAGSTGVSSGAVTADGSTAPVESLAGAASEERRDPAATDAPPRGPAPGLSEAAAAETRSTTPEAPPESASRSQAASSSPGTSPPQAAAPAGSTPPDAPVPPRPTTVAAAVRAERAGEITPLQRNDIVAALRRQRYDARARAAADFRAGRIDRQELKARQRAIDRRYEGR